MTDQDRRFIEAARLLYGGDAAERAAIVQNIVWHVPGHNPVSGDYYGFEEFTQLMPSRMAPLGRWDFTLAQVMVNGHFIVATFRLQGERKGMTLDMDGGHLLRMSDDGKIAEGWGFASDQDALDAFFQG
jgi:ketosteroid isomerase-like protein